MSSSVGRPIQEQETASFQDPVDDGVSEIRVVQYGAPFSERRLVGGEDHGSFSGVTVVDDVEEDVCGVLSIVEISDLIDDEQNWLGVRGESLSEVGFAAGIAELVDELSRSDEASREAVLYGLVCNRDGQVSFSAASFAIEDQGAALGDELRAQIAAQERAFEVRLQREVEVVDGLEKWKSSASHFTLNASAVALSDLLGAEQGEQLSVGPALGLGALAQGLPSAPCVGQV